MRYSQGTECEDQCSAMWCMQFSRQVLMCYTNLPVTEQCITLDYHTCVKYLAVVHVKKKKIHLWQCYIFTYYNKCKKCVGYELTGI